MLTTLTLYKKSKAVDGRTIPMTSFNSLNPDILIIIRGEGWAQEARNISKSVVHHRSSHFARNRVDRSTLNSKDKQENGCVTLSKIYCYLIDTVCVSLACGFFGSEFCLIYYFEKRR